MSNYRRLRNDGSTWFFTVNLHDRRRDPMLVRNIQLLRKCVAAERARRPFTIAGWVVLPDHMHWLWTLPTDDSDYSTRWRRIKTDFSVLLPKAEPRNDSRVSRGERGIWQRRFWEHRINDDNGFRRHMDYIHFNPVKHGLASAPREWPHSSFHEYVARGVYPESWGASEGATSQGERSQGGSSAGGSTGGEPSIEIAPAVNVRRVEPPQEIPPVVNPPSKLHPQ